MQLDSIYVRLLRVEFSGLGPGVITVCGAHLEELTVQWGLDSGSGGVWERMRPMHR